MPNRVDGNVQGTAPAAAQARQAEAATQPQQADAAAPAQADRVEISPAGQDAQAGNAVEPQPDNGRGAAVNAPGAGESTEVERREANRAEQQETAVREQQDTARQQDQNPETGNLVDVTG